MPEWEDHVDADYDFDNDEHSTVARSNRNLAYIWDIFDRDPARTPIDGILISREQIEDSPERARRLKKYGVYDAPDDGTTLAIPEWLPTISDCGAWGYKELPFPPYGNAEMLQFYEQLNVDIGVTIDHLVLGGGHTARLYVNERALPEDYSADDIPAAITEAVDVMVAEWPDEWPDNVAKYEPSLCKTNPVRKPIEDLFDIEDSGTCLEEHQVKEYLRGIAADPRIVYRSDDTQFRYELTMDNLEEMCELYDDGDYSFRLTCAIQGWDAASYAKVTRAALDAGYQYLGIGGVAGRREKAVKRYVSAVGEVVKEYEHEQSTRIDTHVFGFGKTGAFDTIGRSGISSFDTASMLRAAWTGGKNYHLDTHDNARRYDAIRVRYPNYQDEMSTAITSALWAQEVLHALRAYDDGVSLTDAIEEWQTAAKESLDQLETYLEAHRWDKQYDKRRISDIEETIRTHYQYGSELKANFSDRFRKQIIKLLREDTQTDPVSFDKYTALIEEASTSIEQFPNTVEQIEADVDTEAADSSFTAIWAVIKAYTSRIGDEDLRDGYRKLLKDRPWRECSCPICEDLGIEVVIFRGNNRNRRRGFHNTRRFYDRFELELPKVLVVTNGDSSLATATSVEEFLMDHRRSFWSAVHDLPVAEVGVVTANGVHEWWCDPPETVSMSSKKLTNELTKHCARYQSVFIDAVHWDVSEDIRAVLNTVDCSVNIFNDPTELREAVLERLQYDERTIPPHPDREHADQIGIEDF